MSEPNTAPGCAGGCACGSVRYSLRADPMFVHCCHCRDCQRLVGSAFVINAIIETDQISLLKGAPEPTAVPTHSGRPHDVYRCPDCLTALWSDFGHRAYLRFVRTGTLDAPDAVTPDVHIFTRSKLPWVVLPADAQVFEVYYDIATVWPAESLARRRASEQGALKTGREIGEPFRGG
jgi:hypothetical protein